MEIILVIVLLNNSKFKVMNTFYQKRDLILILDNKFNHKEPIKEIKWFKVSNNLTKFKDKQDKD